MAAPPGASDATPSSDGPLQPRHDSSSGRKILVEARGPVTVVTLNRPEVHNCIDAETADLLSDVIRSFADDDRARVMVITGAGNRAFSSGADLTAVDELMQRPGALRNAPLGFSNLEPGKPRIAAVEGYCLGGGIELACWCDFAIAGEDASFGALNRASGVPWVDGGTQRMTRRIGVGNALYLMETGERIDARRAREMGLVQEVVAPGRALERAVELADRVAAYPQKSLLADRSAALATFGMSLEDGLKYEASVGHPTASEPEFREGVRRFRHRKEK
ncbi:MAG TPA: enoyl-CoA hydratase-related protein [Actinomycetota bacterium]|nr:enoyl-CoA hydratase-related protein [Actinomycetota bacterium]